MSDAFRACGWALNRNKPPGGRPSTSGLLRRWMLHLQGSATRTNANTKRSWGRLWHAATGGKLNLVPGTQDDHVDKLLRLWALAKPDTTRSDRYGEASLRLHAALLTSARRGTEQDKVQIQPYRHERQRPGVPRLADWRGDRSKPLAIQQRPARDRLRRTLIIARRWRFHFAALSCHSISGPVRCWLVGTRTCKWDITVSTSFYLTSLAREIAAIRAGELPVNHYLPLLRSPDPQCGHWNGANGRDAIPPASNGSITA